MSVIVKGMEMPKNCAKCKMWSICDCLKEFDDYESLLYAVDDGDWVMADGCPLIELPPHGRLIDADAIQDYNVETFGQRLLIIDTAPTVIEAEGET